MSAPTLRLFTFSPAFGLPTTGPFGLKLEACLRMLEVPYERVYEDDIRKGPKRKSPWIEDEGVRMGDTELIFEHIANKYGKRLDVDLTPAERARSHVLRRTFEEHFHQVFEYELFLDDRGFAVLRDLMKGKVPGPLVPLVAAMMRRSFKKHLFERGIARHAPEEIARMGRADVDALVALLGDGPFVLGERATKVDASIFGLLAMPVLGPFETPVSAYVREQAPLVAYVRRALARFFPDVAGD